MDLSVLRDHVIFRPLKLQFVSDFWMQFFFSIALQIFPKTLFFFSNGSCRRFYGSKYFRCKYARKNTNTCGFSFCFCFIF